MEPPQGSDDTQFVKVQAVVPVVVGIIAFILIFYNHFCETVAVAPVALILGFGSYRSAEVRKFLTDRVGKAGAITALPVGIGLLIFILLFIFIVVMAIWGYM